MLCIIFKNINIWRQWTPIYDWHRDKPQIKESELTGLHWADWASSQKSRTTSTKSLFALATPSPKVFLKMGFNHKKAILKKNTSWSRVVEQTGILDMKFELDLGQWLCLERETVIVGKVPSLSDVHSSDSDRCVQVWQIQATQTDVYLNERH